MRQLILLLFIISSLFSYSQATIKEIKEVQPKYENNNYIFPLIIVRNKKTISDKINNELVLDFLDADRKKIKKSIFENVWSTEEMPSARLSDLSYDVLNNNKKVFSISISAEGCGAYCEYFTNYYSFDLATGDRIKLESLFTKGGQDLLIDSINIKKNAILKAKIKEIQDSLNNLSSETDEEDKMYLTNMLTLYQECLENNGIESLEYMRFYLVKNDLFLLSDRCSAHVNRNLDEIDDFEFVYKLKNWIKYLTPYAIKLISN